MNSDITIEQNVSLINRQILELTGIIDVVAFSDIFIEAEYCNGCIAVEGTDLKIDEFSSETGKLKVCGTINGFFYYGSLRKNKRKLFHR